MSDNDSEEMPTLVASPFEDESSDDCESDSDEEGMRMRMQRMAQTKAGNAYPPHPHPHPQPPPSMSILALQKETAQQIQAREKQKQEEKERLLREKRRIQEEQEKQRKLREEQRRIRREKRREKRRLAVAVPSKGAAADQEPEVIKEVRKHREKEQEERNRLRISVFNISVLGWCGRRSECTGASKQILSDCFAYRVRCCQGCDIWYHKPCYRKVMKKRPLSLLDEAKYHPCLTDMCEGVLQSIALYRDNEVDREILRENEVIRGGMNDDAQAQAQEEAEGESSDKAEVADVAGTTVPRTPPRTAPPTTSPPPFPTPPPPLAPSTLDMDSLFPISSFPSSSVTEEERADEERRKKATLYLLSLRTKTLEKKPLPQAKKKELSLSKRNKRARKLLKKDKIKTISMDEFQQQQRQKQQEVSAFTSEFSSEFCSSYYLDGSGNSGEEKEKKDQLEKHKEADEQTDQWDKASLCGTFLDEVLQEGDKDDLQDLDPFDTSHLDHKHVYSS